MKEIIKVFDNEFRETEKVRLQEAGLMSSPDKLADARKYYNSTFITGLENPVVHKLYKEQSERYESVLTSFADKIMMIIHRNPDIFDSIQNDELKKDLQAILSSIRGGK